MSTDAPVDLSADLPAMWCPSCHGCLRPARAGLECARCGLEFGVSGGIPQLFVPNEWDASLADVTEEVRAFYEETPFPDYDDFDDVGSLIRKARAGFFAKMLDDGLPPGSRILEVGCGTGQLSNFLAIGNRRVYGTDMCASSLRLAQAFKEDNDLDTARFLRMNLFRPAFRPGTFDTVICNGVLHHTSNPFLAFETIAELVKPGGHLLVGLYHRWGRLLTDVRRLLFTLSGDRFKALDPYLRRSGVSDAKRRAWFLDQYKNPHESKHTIGEVLAWMRRVELKFVRSIPRTSPFQPLSPSEDLFREERPGGWLERTLVELGMAFRGAREGGLFIVIGRRQEKPDARAPAQNME